MQALRPGGHFENLATGYVTNGHVRDYNLIGMSRHPTRNLPVTAAVLLLLGGCVKKSEYDALQVENQNLQTRVDQTNHLLVQSQADLSTLQIQMQQFLVVQAQSQKLRQERCSLIGRNP